MTDTENIASIQSTVASPVEVIERHDSELTRVYHAILNAIMDGVLLPGKKLTESDLCRQMVCSRNTVRGALSLLAHDKIVDLLPNRGAFVHVPDLQEIRDVFFMRIALEEMTVDKLAELPDVQEKLVPLYRLVAQQAEAHEAGDRVGRDRLSNAFHIELARVLDNQVLVEMMASLCARSSLMVALTGRAVKHESPNNEHTEMLALLQEGKYRRAAKKMRKHLEVVLAQLEERFEDAEEEAGLMPA
ncbi:GntR family transcriptional regulator [Neisseria sp. 83E34]|uniref:GntR family transcriptional regulator n=1 Tax=Neisseria sp. 83E34 TaxID=1692264 RepID=UPI0006CEA4E4|nr:GntR family transcriptional regulator [Neisseria sp. 83E34]KPN71463.1 GntR family transcriptional regulator [Neisseria sp. 83E34]